MRIPADLALTLVAIVDEGSLEAAARTLHVTQPAVSQRLQSLERIAGQVLLVRSRPPRLTTAGEVVARFARQVALLEADASGELGLGSSGVRSVAIGVNSDTLATWFLEPLARLTERLGVVFELHRDDENRTADLLADGTVVAAVTTRREPVPGCTVTALAAVAYRAVASSGFVERWADAGEVPFARAPVVDLDEYDTLQTRYLQLVGADPAAPPRHRVPSSRDMVRALELGMGWAVLPASQHDEARGLVDLGGPDVVVPLYWQQWRVHSALLDEIAAEIASEAAAKL